MKTQRIHQKAGSHAMDRSDSHDNANEAETPANERMFLMQTKVKKIVQKRQIYQIKMLSLQPESTCSSGSSNSSFSSWYGSVAIAHQGQNAITMFSLISFAFQIMIL
jgi:hypothetical protein